MRPVIIHVLSLANLLLPVLGAKLAGPGGGSDGPSIEQRADVPAIVQTEYGVFWGPTHREHLLHLMGAEAAAFFLLPGGRKA